MSILDLRNAIEDLLESERLGKVLGAGMMYGTKAPEADIQFEYEGCEYNITITEVGTVRASNARSRWECLWTPTIFRWGVKKLHYAFRH